MATVLLIIHVMIALALIGVVLLQRSEGGALGIGGGGGGGFMTGRGAANFLTRVTAGLAAAFFATSLILSLVASQPSQRSILDVPPQGPPGTQPTRPRAPAAPPSQLPTIDLNKTNQGIQVPDTPAPPETPRVPLSK
jgi:preprotein translocase subunit SecG